MSNLKEELLFEKQELAQERRSLLIRGIQLSIKELYLVFENAESLTETDEQLANVSTALFEALKYCPAIESLSRLEKDDDDKGMGLINEYDND
jgi:hypothetical protein